MLRRTKAAVPMTSIGPGCGEADGGGSDGASMWSSAAEVKPNCHKHDALAAP
jgi:hypothetical protein